MVLMKNPTNLNICPQKVSISDAKCEYLLYKTGDTNTKSRRLF